MFVAWGGTQPNDPRGVWVFKRGQLVGELDAAETHPQEIGHLLIFGSWIVGCGTQSIEVWKADSHEHYTSILSTSSSRFTAPLCTLPTLLNKIFVEIGRAHV